MAMSRQDYQDFIEFLVDQNNASVFYSARSFLQFADEFIDFLAARNQRFDRMKFAETLVDAAGIDLDAHSIIGMPKIFFDVKVKRAGLVPLPGMDGI